MNDQTLLIVGLILCSLGGWYVVLHKYLALKAMLNDKDVETEAKSTPKKQQEQDPKKRQICNWASVMHLSGFALLTGIIFLNIVIPSIIWLLKKEQHPYLAKQGREVINFQITLTLIQIAFLLLGTLIVWLLPGAAAALFAWTKSLRIIFSTSMYLPFNLFTALPFFWGCIMMLRGTIAAYYGQGFKYPYSIDLLTDLTSETKPEVSTNPTPDVQPMRINFS